MRKLLLSLSILACCTAVSAQDTTLYTIKAGQKIEDVLPRSDIYHYPQFMDGVVALKNGKTIEAKLNYNRLYDQILFLGSNNDTLAFGDEKNVKAIIIGTDQFYYEDGFIRVIADNDFIKLAESQVWVVADIRKMGSHGRATNTVAVQSFTQFNNGLDPIKSKNVLNEELLLRKETHYYFGNSQHNFARASKKKLLQLFPKDEQQIENYFKENKINFDNKEDVQKLVDFINGLY